MPKGVEHTIALDALAERHALGDAVMPKGVEHMQVWLTVGTTHYLLGDAVMPKGVEHQVGQVMTVTLEHLGDAVMPKGVEHTNVAQIGGVAAASATR